MEAIDVFAVLANPLRRQILELLLVQPQSVNEIVEQFQLSRPTVSEHLKLLRKAQLIRVESMGRERYCHIDPTRLTEVTEWLHPFEKYWVERLSELNNLLNEETEMKETETIKTSQYINHAPEKVWKALTTPDLLRKWWAEGNIKAEVGHEFSLDMGQFGKQECQVIAVEEGRLFQYSFSPGLLDTIITWKLTPDGSGTLLELEHSGFDLTSPIGKQAFKGMGGGWPRVIAGIESAISEETAV
jgi:uncharacterized protein YndB with AHSA1/START domain